MIFNPEHANRGFLRGKYTIRRSEPTAIVLHTTGAGVLARWEREGKRGTPFETALRIYHKLTDAGPHYVVGQRGEVEQTCPLEYEAWHVGKANSSAYFHTWSTSKLLRARYSWWFKRWAYNTPADLCGGTLWSGGSCNANSIGIEVVPPKRDPRGKRVGWGDSCWASLSNLLDELCRASGIPYTSDYIVGHSDAHPIARSNWLGAWDPTPLQLSPEILRASRRP